MTRELGRRVLCVERHGDCACTKRCDESEHECHAVCREQRHAITRGDTEPLLQRARDSRRSFSKLPVSDGITADLLDSRSARTGFGRSIQSFDDRLGLMRIDTHRPIYELALDHVRSGGRPKGHASVLHRRLA